MVSIIKNTNIDKLDDIFHEYNNTYHRTIKMKPADVKSNTYLNSNEENDYKNPKIKFSDQNIKKFCKKLYCKLVQRIFVFKKVKSATPWTYVLDDFNGEKTVETF